MQFCPVYSVKNGVRARDFDHRPIVETSGTGVYILARKDRYHERNRFRTRPQSTVSPVFPFQIPDFPQFKCLFPRPALRTQILLDIGTLQGIRCGTRKRFECVNQSDGDRGDLQERIGTFVDSELSRFPNGQAREAVLQILEPRISGSTFI